MKKLQEKRYEFDMITRLNTLVDTIELAGFIQNLNQSSIQLKGANTEVVLYLDREMSQQA